ncbi:MAG: hypothetical protein ABIV05_08785, partial [Actinomycetota bacterium]
TSIDRWPSARSPSTVSSTWFCPPLMGRWAISGIDLPDDVLRDVYGGNAARLVPALAPALTQPTSAISDQDVTG